MFPSLDEEQLFDGFNSMSVEIHCEATEKRGKTRLDFGENGHTLHTEKLN